MPVNLTSHAIPAVLKGDVNLKPLLQVLEIKLIRAPQDRYKIILSDGVSTEQAMLATQLNDHVKSRKVQNGSVVQLIDYICSTIQNSKVIVVLNMETIIDYCEIIGNPKWVAQSESAPARISSNNCSMQMSGEQFGGTCDPASSVRINYSVTKVPTNVTTGFRPTVQPSYVPPPSYKNRGPIAKNEAPARIVPIAALNPYQGRWAIKARVTAKGDLRRYNNAKGDGKVFSFDLLDSDGGEIRVTCFNSVVDRFHSFVEVGKVYIISKGSLKPAQKNFNHLNHEWEILLDSTSTVELFPDEDDTIPRQQFFFKTISEIETMENNAIVDVIGVVITVNPSMPILRKNGMETQRRILNLKDTSNRIVELSLWGEFCNKEGRELQEMHDLGLFPVLALKSGKVNDFSGKSVGTISSTQLFINPDFPEAHRLRDWFDGEGKHIISQSISRDIIPQGSWSEIRKTVSQIKEDGLGRSERPDWVTIKATITFVKADNFCYTACPLSVGDRQCSRKVSRVGKLLWRCERCDKEFEECDYRYLLQAQVQDQTGLTWVTAFQEAGEELLGCSAKELYRLKHDEQDDARFGEIIRNSLFKQYLFRLKIKEEIYGDEQKVKITVIKAELVDFSAESAHLLNLISKT
ncbi:hypothetical protein H6P81_001877 [Aristolochia fimbriata]|uniref:Replication protein A subunit n=1 Tax=Aristolochia fimbriata TaxID=158543 RepID=A0AAV7F9P4_ARIFI|nr:hypothetical protein H6P81_001877 [Aristolochia fimbriata]